HQRLDVLVEQRLATGVQEQFPLLLYAPGNGALRDDSASTAAELASHGYVIAAIDDVDLAPLPSDFVGDKPLPLVFDYSSEEVFGRFLQTGDSKVRREAKQALTVLDRLTACANVNWHTRVRFDQVGFFGFSFGGAVAAQAATWDPRIAAVANLDGTLFDRAATGALKKPYIVFLTKEDIFPKPLELQSPEPAKRYFAALMERDLREEVGLANQRDGFGLRIRNSYHENLSDQAFSRRFFKTWFLVDPYRVKTIRDAYLLGFFDTYLRGMPSPLLTQAPSPFDEVEILRADPYWLAAVQKSAPEAAAGPN
ncbi:MAG TPA: hypothetical protein VLZ74_15660, partial [Methylocella sp.]|nr:hypothetical protein [Methylocella sp.]